MTDLKAAVIRGAQAIDDRDPWGHDRSRYMNASEAGSCIRKQWFAKHQPETGEPQQWGYARRGHAVERYVVEALVAANMPLLFSGPDQVSVQDEAAHISATPDGVFAWDDKTWEGLEIKSIDPRTNKSRLPREGHVTQLRISMALMSKQAPAPIKRGWLLYVDASNFDDIITFEVEAEDGIIGRLAPRAKKVLDTKRVDILDREGIVANECKLCPFKAACGVDFAAMETTRKRANRGSNLDTDARRFVELKEQGSALEVESKELADSIKTELVKRGTSRVVVGDIVVDLQKIAGRTSFDKAAAKKAGVDVSAFEKTGAPSERLIVQRVV